MFGNPQHAYTRRLLDAVPVPDPSHQRHATPRLTGEVPSPVYPLGLRPPTAMLRDAGRGIWWRLVDGRSSVAARLSGQPPARGDGGGCHTAIIDRQATAITPIRKNGRPCKEDCPAALGMVLGPVADHLSPRNETLRATRHNGRAFRERWTGYHARSRIETKIRCLKAFGERIAARDPDRQTAEIPIRLAPMNRFSALGMAEIVRVA